METKNELSQLGVQSMPLHAYIYYHYIYLLLEYKQNLSPVDYKGVIVLLY